MIVSSANRILKWTVLLTSAASLALAAWFVYMLSNGGTVAVLAILIAVCLINVLGLMRLTSWARVTSTVMLWLGILSPLGRFTPMSVDQYASHGQAPPNLLYLILTTLLIAIPCGIAIYVFRRYRQQFRQAWF